MKKYRKRKQRLIIYIIGLTISLLAAALPIFMGDDGSKQNSATDLSNLFSKNYNSYDSANENYGDRESPDPADDDGKTSSAYDKSAPENPTKNNPRFNLKFIPKFKGSPYYIVNNNKTFFKSSEVNTKVFEIYTPLDYKKRCGTAYANLCPQLMPKYKRRPIWKVYPSGWQKIRYDSIPGHSLYNRSHLIAHKLAGENANRKNLITGTQYMNNVGMSHFESIVTEYISRTGNHVLYRVTPVFERDNLVASGVLMEGKSVEDSEIEFCAYCYNVQPGFDINYLNGRCNSL